MRGEDGGDQCVIEQRADLGAVDAFGFELGDRRGEVGAVFRGDALAVLGEVGEHREQHEAADEIERLVEAELFEAEIDRAIVAGLAFGGVSVALDRGFADRLGGLEQTLAAIGADDVAKQFAEETDVGIVRDCGEASHHSLLRCGRVQVNREWRIGGVKSNALRGRDVILLSLGAPGRRH